MIGRLRALVDPYIAMLIGTVVLASLLPPRGWGATFFDGLATAAIVALFFLHGAKLSRAAVWDGARKWKLHTAVLLTTFAFFPLLGLAIAATGLAPPVVSTGLLFLTLLPSTVQSSIAFTAIAKGDVAAAVVSASFSNLLGIAITPILAALLMHRTAATLSFDTARAIVLQLLLPFVAGNLMRPLIGGWVASQKRLVATVDRGSILLVVYTAFSAAVVDGLWHRVGLSDLAQILGWSAAILAIVLALTAVLGRVLRLPREDGIVLQFCGSKKSLATGVPMAGVLFAPAQVGGILLPLMLFHQLQLFACTILARRHAANAGETDR